MTKRQICSVWAQMVELKEMCVTNNKQMTAQSEEEIFTESPQMLVHFHTGPDAKGVRASSQVCTATYDVLAKMHTLTSG